MNDDFDINNPSYHRKSIFQSAQEHADYIEEITKEYEAKEALRKKEFKEYEKREKKKKKKKKKFDGIKAKSEEEIENSNLNEENKRKAYAWFGRGDIWIDGTNLNCSNCTDCQDCYECTNCTGCVDCAFVKNSVNCFNCVDSEDCEECVDCHDCEKCVRCNMCFRCVASYEAYDKIHTSALGFKKYVCNWDENPDRGKKGGYEMDKITINEMVQVLKNAMYRYEYNAAKHEIIKIREDNFTKFDEEKYKTFELNTDREKDNTILFIDSTDKTIIDVMYLLKKIEKPKGE